MSTSPSFGVTLGILVLRLLWRHYGDVTKLWRRSEGCDVGRSSLPSDTCSRSDVADLVNGCDTTAYKTDWRLCACIYSCAGVCLCNVYVTLCKLTVIVRRCNKLTACYSSCGDVVTVDYFRDGVTSNSVMGWRDGRSSSANWTLCTYQFYQRNEQNVFWVNPGRSLINIWIHAIREYKKTQI